MVKDVLIFDSDAFSIEPPLDERGLQYDLPLGDDIADCLKERLDGTGMAWTINEPVNEDYGTVLMLERGKEVFTITISWQGDKSWAMVFGQMRGCLGWLFNGKPATEPLREIRLLVNDIFSETRSVSEIRSGSPTPSSREWRNVSSFPKAHPDASSAN